MSEATTFYLQKLQSIESFHIHDVGHDPYTPQYDVDVQWNLTWTNANYLDKNGPQAWGFTMVRNQLTGRWVIIDEGTG